MESGAFYLHKREWPLRVGRKLHPELCPQDLEFGLASGTQIHITGETMMWNSGVVGIPHGNELLLADALDLCDKYYALLPGWHVEQFSLSIVLQRTERLRGCRSTFYHYWHGKQLALKMIGQVESLITHGGEVQASAMRKAMRAFQLEATVQYYYNLSRVFLRKNQFLYRAYLVMNQR